MQVFDFKPVRSLVLHSCCDFCAQKCDCEGTGACSTQNLTDSLVNVVPPNAEARRRPVSKQQMLHVERLLFDYMYKATEMDPLDIIPREDIVYLVSRVALTFSEDDIQEQISVSRTHCANLIQIINDVFHDCDLPDV